MLISGCVPTWYIVLATLLSCYYAYRGFAGNLIAWEERNLQKTPPLLPRYKIIGVYCIHDALFHLLSSSAGFVALLMAYRLGESFNLTQPFDAGKSVLLTFLFLFGFIGATGQLPQLILQGKLPFIK